MTPYEMTSFAVLGALMYCSKAVMEWAPNIHLLGMFTMTFALAYRTKGLIPLYVYVFLNGLFAGFAVWWIPYLYIWTILWGVTVILPKRLPVPVSAVMYSAVCGLHGLLFGVMYAPVQALFFGLDFNQTLAWIAAGLPFDIMHAIADKEGKYRKRKHKKLNNRKFFIIALAKYFFKSAVSPIFLLKRRLNNWQIIGITPHKTF